MVSEEEYLSPFPTVLLHLLLHIQYLCCPIFWWLLIHDYSLLGTQPCGFDSPRQDQGAEDSDFNISGCVGAQNAHLAQASLLAQ